MTAKVLVCGPRLGKVDPWLFGYVMEAVHDFSRQLGISRFKTNITVRVHERLTIANTTHEGEVEPMDDRSFVIDVCLYGNWLSTLAHEMVHVKQYLRGELNWSLSKWKGKSGYEDVEYWDLPWEVEARKLQHKLVGKFERLI